MKKALPLPALVFKNYAELALRWNIRDPEILHKVFSTDNQDFVFDIHFNEVRENEPESIQIRAFNLSWIHDRACIVFNAMRESGKTVLMYQLIASKSFLKQGYCVSASEGASHYWEPIFGERHTQELFDPEDQHEILAVQEQCTTLYMSELAERRFCDPRAINIQEDCAWDNKVHYDSGGLDRIAMSGRHYHLLNIITTQRMQKVSTSFRDNCDLIVLFRSDNADVRKEVWRQWGSFISERRFLQIWDEVTSTPFHALLIMNRGQSRFEPPENRLFHFKARTEEEVDKLLPGWRVGRDEQSAADEEATVDQAELERLRMFRNIEDMQQRFEASPLSLSERYLQQRRRVLGKRIYDDIEDVVARANQKGGDA